MSLLGTLAITVVVITVFILIVFFYFTTTRWSRFQPLLKSSINSIKKSMVSFLFLSLFIAMAFSLVISSLYTMNSQYNGFVYLNQNTVMANQYAMISNTSTNDIIYAADTNDIDEDGDTTEDIWQRDNDRSWLSDDYIYYPKSQANWVLDLIAVTNEDEWDIYKGTYHGLFLSDDWPTTEVDGDVYTFPYYYELSDPTSDWYISEENTWVVNENNTPSNPNDDIIDNNAYVWAFAFILADRASYYSMDDDPMNDIVFQIDLRFNAKLETESGNIINVQVVMIPEINGWNTVEYNGDLYILNSVINDEGEIYTGDDLESGEAFILHGASDKNDITDGDTITVVSNDSCSGSTCNKEYELYVVDEVYSANFTSPTSYLGQRVAETLIPQPSVENNAVIFVNKETFFEMMYLFVPENQYTYDSGYGGPVAMTIYLFFYSVVNSDNFELNEIVVEILTAALSPIISSSNYFNFFFQIGSPYSFEKMNTDLNESLNDLYYEGNSTESRDIYTDNYYSSTIIQQGFSSDSGSDIGYSHLRINFNDSTYAQSNNYLWAPETYSIYRVVTPIFTLIIFTILIVLLMMISARKTRDNRKEIGILKAQGYSSRMISLSALVYSLLAISVGLTFSFFMVPLFILFWSSTITSTLILPVIFSPNLVATSIAILLPLLLMISASLLVVYRLVNKPSLSLMNDSMEASPNILVRTLDNKNSQNDLSLKTEDKIEDKPKTFNLSFTTKYSLKNSLKLFSKSFTIFAISLIMAILLGLSFASITMSSNTTKEIEAMLGMDYIGINFRSNPTANSSGTTKITDDEFYEGKDTEYTEYTFGTDDPDWDNSSSQEQWVIMYDYTESNPLNGRQYVTNETAIEVVDSTQGMIDDYNGGNTSPYDGEDIVTIKYINNILSYYTAKDVEYIGLGFSTYDDSYQYSMGTAPVTNQKITFDDGKYENSDKMILFGDLYEVEEAFGLEYSSGMTIDQIYDEGLINEDEADCYVPVILDYNFSVEGSRLGTTVEVGLPAFMFFNEETGEQLDISTASSITDDPDNVSSIGFTVPITCTDDDGNTVPVTFEVVAIYDSPIVFGTLVPVNDADLHQGITIDDGDSSTSDEYVLMNIKYSNPNGYALATDSNSLVNFEKTYSDVAGFMPRGVNPIDLNNEYFGYEDENGDYIQEPTTFTNIANSPYGETSRFADGSYDETSYGLLTNASGYLIYTDGAIELPLLENFLETLWDIVTNILIEIFGTGLTGGATISAAIQTFVQALAWSYYTDNGGIIDFDSNTPEQDEPSLDKGQQPYDEWAIVAKYNVNFFVSSNESSIINSAYNSFFTFNSDMQLSIPLGTIVEAGYSVQIDPYNAIIIPYALIAVLIAFIMLIFVLYEVILSSMKEARILTSLGYTPRTTAKITLAGYFFVFLLAGLISIPLSILMFSILESALSTTFILVFSVTAAQFTIIISTILLAYLAAFPIANYTYGKNSTEAKKSKK